MNSMVRDLVDVLNRVTVEHCEVCVFLWYIAMLFEEGFNILKDELILLT